MKFNNFFSTQLGFKRRKSTGYVDISEVYTSGRYFVGPDYTFKVFQANAHFVKLDEISVWTDDKVEIEISCSFQYFLRKDFLSDLHEAYNVDYEPVVRGTAIDAIKGRAADLPIDDYIRFVCLLNFSDGRSSYFYQFLCSRSGLCEHQVEFWKDLLFGTTVIS